MCLKQHLVGTMLLSHAKFCIFQALRIPAIARMASTRVHSISYQDSIDTILGNEFSQNFLVKSHRRLSSMRRILSPPSMLQSLDDSYALARGLGIDEYLTAGSDHGAKIAPIRNTTKSVSTAVWLFGRINSDV